jgi:hypothetical protein
MECRMKKRTNSEISYSKSHKNYYKKREIKDFIFESRKP